MLVACSAPPEPVPKATPVQRDSLPVTADDICTIHCERAETCGVFRDACERDCPARGRPIDKMRADFVGGMMLCLEGASCAALKEGAAWGGCHSAIVKTLPVTPTLRKFCFQSARRAAQCERAEEADQIACLTQFRYNNDAALTDAMKCIERTCAEVPGCMGAALTR